MPKDIHNALLARLEEMRPIFKPLHDYSVMSLGDVLIDLAVAYVNERCLECGDSGITKRVFMDNHGAWGEIVRHVRSVTRDGTVSYLNNGALFRVKKSTFRRWANCAELTSAEDWSGR